VTDPDLLDPPVWDGADLSYTLKSLPWFLQVRDLCPALPASGESIWARSESGPLSPLEKTVAANCDVCGKGPGFGHSISHSHRRTKRRWNPNIQSVRAVIGRTPKRLNVCTSCLKAGKVARA
jgi:large subunit ribosomal protein L28